MSTTGFGWRLHGDGEALNPARSWRERTPRLAYYDRHWRPACGGDVRRNFLVPLLTGFPPTNHAVLLGSGHRLVPTDHARERVPSYLDASFIAPLAAATNQHGPAGALGRAVMAGLSLFLVGVIVRLRGPAG